MTAPPIAGLILAGGASKRMGSPKALLTIEGQTFVDRLVGVFRETCSPVVVVLGHAADRIHAGMLRVNEARLAVNADPGRGMLSSLQCGLDEIPGDVEAVIFTPVDYPSIQASTIASLARAFAAYRSPVTLPTHQGRRGHPVCISSAVAQQLRALPVNAQARDVIRSFRAQTRWVEVPDPGILTDIDHPEDYQLLQRQFACVES